MTILGALKNVHFVDFQPSKGAKIQKNQNSEASKGVKMADFALLQSPKLISRKIGVILEKLRNSNLQSSASTTT